MSVFRFKHFEIHQQHAALKVGTDAMVLGALCNFPRQARLLDIGTGTGVLALMCAQRFQAREITGIDLSPEAIKDAQRNFSRSPFSNTSLRVEEIDLAHFEDKPYNGIICNPPYFIDAMKASDTAKNMARHTDSLSYETLAFHCKRLLHTNGTVWLICPAENAIRMSDSFQKEGFIIQQEITILGKPGSHTRTVFCFGYDLVQVRESELLIREESGKYSEAYKKLTLDFHDRKLP